MKNLYEHTFDRKESLLLIFSKIGPEQFLVAPLNSLEAPPNNQKVPPISLEQQ